MSEKCTKTSPPSSLVMNPNPLESLNHLTVPFAIQLAPPSLDIEDNGIVTKKTAKQRIFAAPLTTKPSELKKNFASSQGKSQVFFLIFPGRVGEKAPNTLQGAAA